MFRYVFSAHLYNSLSDSHLYGTVQSSSHQYTSSQSASRELTTATQQPDAVAAAAAVVAAAVALVAAAVALVAAAVAVVAAAVALVAAAAAVVDRRRPSSDRELDMLTSTPLVLDPVDVSVLPLVSRSDPVDVFNGA